VIDIKKNHNLGECAICLWNLENGYSGCEVFLDKRDVILNDKGKCNAAIYNKEEKEKLEKELVDLRVAITGRDY
jgi:hypothetical protein